LGVEQLLQPIHGRRQQRIAYVNRAAALHHAFDPLREVALALHAP
jgi:hypothetical protein